MKKFITLFLMTIALLLPIAFPRTSEAVSRRKTPILVIYKNFAHTGYDKELDAIVNAELQKRLEGLYLELDSSSYASQLGENSLTDDNLYDISTVFDGSGAKYLVYVELLPLGHSTNYNLAYVRKTLYGSVFLWLVDLEKQSTIYRNSIMYKDKDATMDWWIGNKSVAKEALKKGMYKVGETISVQLPL